MRIRRCAAWAAAWIASGWLAVFVTDWSFACAVPDGVVPLAALTWAGLGIAVIVQAILCGHGARVTLKILLLAAMPLSLVFTVVLVVMPIGPPSDIALRTEFGQDRVRFDRVADLYRALGPPRVESDPVAEAARARTEALLQPHLSALGVTGVRQAGRCVRLVRWSGSFRTRAWETGFFFADGPIAKLEEPVDRDVFLRGGTFFYEPLEGGWFAFRAVY